MARMHTRTKGKSGSTKPVDKTPPQWLNYSAKEVENLVVKLAKEEKPSTQIGLELRDTYGVPSVKAVTGKQIAEILNEHKLSSDLPEDLTNLIQKSIAVRKHMEQNITDKTAKRGLQLTESKIRRMIKYYKATGKVPSDWKYDPKQAAMYL